MSNTTLLFVLPQKLFPGVTKSVWPKRRTSQKGPVSPPGRHVSHASTGPATLRPSKSHRRGLIGFLLCLFLLTLLTGCGPKQAGVVLDAEDQFALAKREFEERNYERAVIEFQKLVFNYPGAIFVDSAQYLLGRCYFNQADYPLAVMEFNRLISSFPTSQLSDDAAFMVAFCYYKMSAKAELDQKHTEQAIEELENFLDDYPTSDRAEEAQDLLRESRSKLAKKSYETGRLYFKMKKYDAALIYLKEVVNGFRDTQWVAAAQFQVAEVYFKQKKYDQAKGEYEKFLENFPGDKLATKAKKRLKKLNSENRHAEK